MLPSWSRDGPSGGSSTSGTIFAIVFLASDANCGTYAYKTTNATSTSPKWVDVGPSDDVPFDVVEVDPRNPSLVYAGSDSGLWVSGDTGATWQKVGPDRGLAYAPVYDIKINPATNLTVVFTHGRGAFKLAPG